MKRRFNSYPELERKYGNIAFDVWKKDQEFIDKIKERETKLPKIWGKYLKDKQSALGGKE